MIRIVYCPDGQPVSDFDAESWIHNILLQLEAGHDQTHKVSTSLPIHLIKLQVALGLIPADQVVFVAQDQDILVNQYGAILDWPTGFADILGRTAEQTLRAAILKKQKEHSEL